MTNAHREIRSIVEHRFVVPCAEPWGGTWDDFEVAQHWARQKADELGFTNNTADWSRIHVEDDQLVIVVTEEKYN